MRVSAPLARRWRMWVVTVLVVAPLGACGSDTSDTSDGAAQTVLAERFVEHVHAAGVAPRLTVEMADALYGDDAPAVCGAFDGDLSSSARNVLFGNLSQGRRKAITDDAVTYGRLVVETYCPDQLGDFDRAVRDLDPIERSRS